MKKPFSTYRFIFVIVLIASLLGAAGYAPFLKKVEKPSAKLSIRKQRRVNRS